MDESTTNIHFVARSLEFLLCLFALGLFQLVDGPRPRHTDRRFGIEITLVTQKQSRLFDSNRIESARPHGTPCRSKQRRRAVATAGPAC